MTKPYYSDDTVTLYLGDMREVVPALDIEPDCMVADPPYAETSLAWDRWPDGWPDVVADVADSLWCFGSMRMFLDRRDEFAAWKLSQDVVWEKQQGTGLAADRFRRVHEFALHWYRGGWGDVHHDTPRDGVRGVVKVGGRSGASKAWHGERGASVDARDGSALLRSVLKVRNLNGRAAHPTEKPVGLLDPLIRYACPPGGLVLDPFAGSGSTAEAARLSGRRAVLIERHEPYCEAIARRLSADVAAAGGDAVSVAVAHAIVFAAATIAGALLAGGLLALFLQPRDPHPHLARLDADGCLCCGTTDHRIWR